MTPLQQTLVRLALEVNAQATIRNADDFDRKFAEIGIDSLEAMSLMLAVTEHFKVDIPDAEIDQVASLNGLARLVERELAAAGR